MVLCAILSSYWCLFSGGVTLRFYSKSIAFSYAIALDRIMDLKTKEF